MNTSLPALRVASLVWTCAAGLAFSQGVPQGPGSVRRMLVPNAPVAGGNAEASKPLSTNHRITFFGKAGEKALGELSCLTNSPTVFISGPLDDSANPTSFDVRGAISEREGGLIVFEYQIGFEVALTSGAPNAAPGAARPIQYQRHSCSGSLLMRPGKAYEILKAGGCAYSVMITPEVEK